jgi:hypothetical protein
MQMTPKQQFIDGYDREHATTMRVLKAFPDGNSALRPHAKLKTARELAWIFVQEQALCSRPGSTGPFRRRCARSLPRI